MSTSLKSPDSCAKQIISHCSECRAPKEPPYLGTVFRPAACTPSELCNLGQTNSEFQSLVRFYENFQFLVDVVGAFFMGPIMYAIKGYSAGQIILHWLSAAMVFFLLLPVSRAGHLLPENSVLPDVPMTLHVWTGLALVPVTATRLALRLTRGVPAPDAMEPPFLCGAGRFAHTAMYACLFILPLSGVCHWYLGMHTGYVIHEGARVLLTFLVGLHMVGASVHHFIFRNSVLTRICRPER